MHLILWDHYLLYARNYFPSVEYVPVTDPVSNEFEWQVHMCNKLASRHIRVGLAAPNAVPKCDICENAPGGWFSTSE